MACAFARGDLGAGAGFVENDVFTVAPRLAIISLDG